VDIERKGSEYTVTPMRRDDARVDVWHEVGAEQITLSATDAQALGQPSSSPFVGERRPGWPDEPTHSSRRLPPPLVTALVCV
jgi:hypothetical protein